MEYGYFDRENNEYVITNPKTPSPWMYYAATQYILGIRPDYQGLVIDPKNSRRLGRFYSYKKMP